VVCKSKCCTSRFGNYMQCCLVDWHFSDQKYPPSVTSFVASFFQVPYFTGVNKEQIISLGKRNTFLSDLSGSALRSFHRVSKYSPTTSECKHSAWLQLSLSLLTSTQSELRVSFTKIIPPVLAWPCFRMNRLALPEHLVHASGYPRSAMCTR